MGSESSARLRIAAAPPHPSPTLPSPASGEGREGACRGTVKRIVQNGRSTFYCPACQK
ncbi:MAG: zinc finger domain-containing protein [Xanthobacteraceae bacterium]